MIYSSQKDNNMVLMQILPGEGDLYPNTPIDKLCILYKLPNSKTIHIGSIVKNGSNFTITNGQNNPVANEADKILCYNGGSSLENISFLINDRPVYKVTPTDENTILEYTIINKDSQKGLEIPLGNLIKTNNKTRNR